MPIIVYVLAGIFIVILLCGMCYDIGFNNGWYAAIKKYLPAMMSEQKDEEEQEGNDEQ